jgi:hypothetical protein
MKSLSYKERRKRTRILEDELLLRRAWAFGSFRRYLSKRVSPEV